MILWFDKDFEPQTTENTAWAATSSEAIMSILMGMPLEYIDTEDTEEAFKFITFLNDIGMLKYIRQVNIHGSNILNQEYKKKISELCNQNNVLITFKLPDITKLKKANVDPERLGGNTYVLQSSPMD